MLLVNTGIYIHSTVAKGFALVPKLAETSAFYCLLGYNGLFYCDEPASVVHQSAIHGTHVSLRVRAWIRG